MFITTLAALAVTWSVIFFCFLKNRGKSPRRTAAGGYVGSLLGALFSFRFTGQRMWVLMILGVALGFLLVCSKLIPKLWKLIPADKRQQLAKFFKTSGWIVLAAAGIVVLVLLLK